MRFETTRFGAIEFDEAAIIRFTQPMLGFQEHKRFITLPGPNAILTWLQSVDAPNLAFIMVDPKAVAPGYTVDLRDHELAELGATSAEQLMIYTLLVVPKDPMRVRTNLKAPIVINPATRLAKQLILENSDYPIQYYLAQSERQSSGQEARNASTHA